LHAHESHPIEFLLEDLVLKMEVNQDHDQYKEDEKGGFPAHRASVLPKLFNQ